MKARATINYALASVALMALLVAGTAASIAIAISALRWAWRALWGGP